MTAALEQRSLGRSGHLVSTLCMGGSLLGSMPAVFGYEYSEEQAVEVVGAVFKTPITFLDTSAGYSDGESERRVGVAIRAAGGLPADFVLASKADPDPITGDFSGDQVMRCVETSLRRLGVETLPLYYLHDPERITFDVGMASGGPVAALVRARDEGLVQSIGVAGGPLAILDQYLRTDVFDVVLTHNRYTLVDQSAGPLIDFAHASGLGVVNAAPFGGGILAKGSRATDKYAYRPATSEVLQLLSDVEELCRRYNIELAAAALQFSIRNPNIASTVVTMSSPLRVQQALAHAGIPIPEAFWEELQQLQTHRAS